MTIKSGVVNISRFNGQTDKYITTDLKYINNFKSIALVETIEGNQTMVKTFFSAY
jgi:hypothetical protein